MPWLLVALSCDMSGDVEGSGQPSVDEGLGHTGTSWSYSSRTRNSAADVLDD
jgi:hypothetical protein